MSAPANLKTVDANVGPVEANGLFGRAWYLFFNAIATTVNYSLAQVAYLLIQAADLLSRDYVYGGAVLTHVGRLTKVASAGTLAESAVTDDGTAVTVALRQLAQTGALPAFTQSTTGGTQPARLGKIVSDDEVRWSINLSWDGANWNLDDVSKTGTMVTLIGGALYIQTATAGANPRTLTDAAVIDGIANLLEGNLDLVDGTKVYKIGGVQVLGARLAAITSPTGGGTVVAAPAGGVTIDIQARAAIVSIISAIASTGNTVDPSSRAAIAAIISRLSTTGITA